jgi:dynein heavy chain, axonemal
LDGAAWHSNDATLTESQPKKLFASLPILLVSAMSKKNKNTTSNVDYGAHGGYECPVYKYPLRTDKYLIFSVTLPSLNHRPLHWTLRGVSLLCATSS